MRFRGYDGISHKTSKYSLVPNTKLYIESIVNISIYSYCCDFIDIIIIGGADFLLTFPTKSSIIYSPSDQAVSTTAITPALLVKSTGT